MTPGMPPFMPRLLAEIATAENTAEVATIVQRHDRQMKALPGWQYELASEAIIDALNEYRQRNKL
jgi:hypothetical protein